MNTMGWSLLYYYLPLSLCLSLLPENHPLSISPSPWLLDPWLDGSRSFVWTCLSHWPKNSTETLYQHQLQK